MPEAFVCPIWHEVMMDPVVAADGHSYERSAIERWLCASLRPTSPMTGLPLPTRDLVPNFALRQTIEAMQLAWARQAPLDNREVALRAVARASEALHRAVGVAKTWGTPELFTRAICLHPQSDGPVMLAVLEAIHHVTLNDPRASDLLLPDPHCIQAVVAFLRDHQDHPKTAALGWKAMSLMNNALSTVLFLDASVLPLLLHSLKKDCIPSLLGARVLLEHCPSTRHEFWTRDALLILDEMRRLTHKHGLLCGMVLCLSLIPPLQKPGIAPKIHGAVEQAIALFHERAASAEAVLKMCAAFLAGCTPSPQCAQHICFLAMRSLEMDDRLPVRILASLPVHPYKHLDWRAVIRSMVSRGRASPLESCIMVRRWGEGNPECLRALYEAGAWEMVVEAMAESIEEKETQRQGLAALNVLQTLF
jgi:hypothetical protein